MINTLIVPESSIVGYGVGAILITPKNEVLMQLRDDDVPIWFPGRWGLFGGAIDKGETPQKALIRELYEEININVSEPKYFTQVAFDARPWDGGIRGRFIYVVPINRRTALGAKKNLKEGKDCTLISLEDLNKNKKILVPYDEFALKLYSARDHLAETARRP